MYRNDEWSTSRLSIANAEHGTAGVLTLQLGAKDKYEKFEVLEVARRYDASWVYRCKAEGLDRVVAVRISLDGVSDPIAARRALRDGDGWSRRHAHNTCGNGFACGPCE